MARRGDGDGDARGERRPREGWWGWGMGMAAPQAQKCAHGQDGGWGWMAALVSVACGGSQGIPNFYMRFVHPGDPYPKGLTPGDRI